jgi:hypothetical protein
MDPVARTSFSGSGSARDIGAPAGKRSLNSGVNQQPTMGQLTESEFQVTFSAPMQRLGMDEGPPFDFWPYFESIPAADFDGVDCSAGAVTYVYRHPKGQYEHVLVDSDDRDVFMVLVLDRQAKRVVGHRLLNLPAMYNLAG